MFASLCTEVYTAALRVGSSSAHPLKHNFSLFFKVCQSAFYERVEMKIVDFLARDSVKISEAAANKKETLELLAEIAADKTDLNKRTVLDALIERERLGTTGVGRGVALPHTRLVGIDKIFCAFLKTPPVDFEAVDEQPVDLLFLLLVPEKDGADHLKALARLSRILRNESVTEQLRAAKTPDELYKIIKENDNDA